MSKLPTICFVTNGVLPVPAVNGGAVQNLVQSLLNKNEEFKQLQITVLSIFSGGIEEASIPYQYTSFCFFKETGFIRFLDKTTFFLAYSILHKRNAFSYRYIFRRLYFIYKCSQYLKRNYFEKIILENHHSLFLLLKNKKLKERIQDKIYYHAHNQPYNDYLCRQEIVDCKNYITVSEYIRNAYKDRYDRITSNIFVLKNAVNTSLFSQKLNYDEYVFERKKYGLLPDDIIILFTGRISKEKGIIELLKAFTELHNPRVKLLIVGSNFYKVNSKDPLNRQLKTILHYCMDRVVFTGYIEYEKIWQLYKIADIGCFPSIVNEAAPLIVIESMVAGLPYITTNSGGIPEYAKPKCAFILERNTDLVENIKTALMTLIDDPELRKMMGRAGEKISNQYNLDCYYQNFVKIIS